MLTRYANKLMACLPGAPEYLNKALAAPPPGAAHGRCPGCNATGPLVVDRRGGAPRPVVFTCRCGTPPHPVLLEDVRS